MRFLVWFDCVEASPPSPPLNGTSTTALSRLYGYVDRFVDDYAGRAWHALNDPDPYNCALPSWATSRLNLAPALPSSHWWPKQPLTETERARLQRSFIRYELICQRFLFRGIPPRTPYAAKMRFVDPERDLERCLGWLCSWEIEELTCISHYFASLVGRLVDEIEDNFVREVIEVPGVQLPAQWRAISAPGPNPDPHAVFAISKYGTRGTPTSTNRLAM